MIVGRDYDMSSIAEIEEREWNDYFMSEPAEEINAFIYYKWVFSKLLRQNGDDSYQEADKEEKESLLNIETDKFTDAMYRSMKKGHQNAFNVIMQESTKFPSLDEDFFKNPNSKPEFIFLIDDKTDDDTYEQTLNQQELHQLVTYTRRHFNDMYRVILECGKIFYQRGEALAFEQIRKDIVGVEYDTPLISNMTHAPLNRAFRITPSFLAKFKFEAPFNEQWDIIWDESYGRAYYGNLVGSLTINQFTVDQVNKYSEGGTRSFKLIHDFLNTDKLPETDNVYLAEAHWDLIDPSQWPRMIYEFEYILIRRSLASTLSQLLEADAKHLLLLT